MKILVFILALLPTFASAEVLTEQANVYGINTLTPALQTVCVAGDSSIYEYVRKHAAEEPSLTFVMLHEHSSTPAQPEIHYYWVKASLASCGAIMAWVTNSSSPAQIFEAFDAVKESINMGKTPVLVGVSPDYVNIAQWRNHLGQAKVTLQNSLDNVWIGKAYIDGRVGTRTQLIKTNQ